MNSTYKPSEILFARMIVRGTIGAAIFLAALASAYAPSAAYRALAATNTPPVITLSGAATTTLSINTAFVDPGATATDTEDGDLTSHILVTGTVATTTAGTSTLTYTVTDNGGLSASVERDVIVVGAPAATNTPPVITLNGSATTTISLNASYSDPGATATDTEDGDLTSHIVTTGTVATTSVGTSTLTYTVTDSGGLIASIERDVVVVDNSATTSTSTGSGSTGSSGSGSTSTSTPSTGSITFCKMVWNGNASVFATSSSGLPDGTFQLYSNYAGPLSTSTGSTTLSFSPVSFSAQSFGANTTIFGTDNNAQCVTETGLDFGYYRYSEEGISGTTSTSTDLQWNTPLYNDQFNASVNAIGDFLTFSTSTDQNSDGIISIGPNRPDRTLIVLNSFGSSTPVIPPSGGGGGGSSGGTSGGGTSGGSSGGGSSSGGSSSGSGHSSSGGGSSSGSGTSSGGGAISCSYLTSYLKIGADNDPAEVQKLQSFLVNYEGDTSVSVSGIFDQATFKSVEAFQQKYYSDILAPWGYAPNQPTGYVYILTRKKINEIVCNTSIPLTYLEQQDISLFSEYMNLLKQQGIAGLGSPAAGGNGAVSVPVSPVVAPASEAVSSTTASTTSVGGTSTEAMGTSTNFLQKGGLANLAAAVFSLPQNGSDFTRCLFNFIIILAIIYIITSILVNNDEAGELARRRSRTRKLWFYLAGIIIAGAFALFFDMFCLVAPLLLVLLILIIVLIVWAVQGQNGGTPGTPVLVGSGNPQTPLVVPAAPAAETKKEEEAKPAVEPKAPSWPQPAAPKVEVPPSAAAPSESSEERE